MQVDIEGVGLAEFPDDAKPDEIAAFVNKKYGNQSGAAPAIDYSRLVADASPTTGEIKSPRDVAMQADAIDRKYQSLSDGANPEQMQAQRLQELADLKSRANAVGQPFDVLKSDDQLLAEKVQAAKLTPEEMSAFVGPKAAKILAPIERGIAGGAGALASSDNVLYAPLAEQRIAAALAKPIAAAMLTQGGIEEAKAANDIAQGNVAQGVEAAVTALPSVVFGAAGARSGARPVEPTTQGPPAPGSILKMPPGATPKGEPNARQESEPTEVHGNVQSQPIRSPGEVPTEESGAGIQPQTTGRLPPGPGEEATSTPRDVPLTPMPGERLVTIQKADGTTYQASYGDQIWPGAGPGGEDVPMIARPLGDKWNHGVLHADEKIVEDTGAPKSEIPNQQPEISTPEPIKSTEPTVSAAKPNGYAVEYEHNGVWHYETMQPDYASARKEAIKRKGSISSWRIVPVWDAITESDYSGEGVKDRLVTPAVANAPAGLRPEDIETHKKDFQFQADQAEKVLDKAIKENWRPEAIQEWTTQVAQLRQFAENPPTELRYHKAPKPAAPSTKPVDFSPEAKQQRLDKVKTHPISATEGNRWQAIENTYIRAKAAQEALPGVPLKDIFSVIIKQGHYPSSPEVDHFFVERSKLNEFTDSLTKEYPPGKFTQNVQPGSTPYAPRKGEPSFKDWLAGKRPPPEPIKSTGPTVPTAGEKPPLEEIGDRPVSAPEEPATFGANKLPLGVSKAQWDAMAKLSENEQQKKYGTSRSRLIEKAILADHKARTATEPEFKVGDKLEHDGKIKTVTRVSHNPDYVILNKKLVKISETKPVTATEPGAGTPPANPNEPEQFDLLEAPRSKPIDAQIIQLRRMMETAERLYGKSYHDPRAQAIANKLGPLEEYKLRERFGGVLPEEKTAQPQETPPEPVTTPVPEENSPVQPESPIPEAAPPVKTFDLGNVDVDINKSKLTLKVQKQFLLAAVDKAMKEMTPPKWTAAQNKLFNEGRNISDSLKRLGNGPGSAIPRERLNQEANAWTAKMKATLPYITFDVPGDGVFHVLQSANALGEFRAMVQKQFPVGKGASGKPSMARITPAPAPSLVENPELKDIVKAIASHASTDETRGPLLNAIYSNGKEIVTTDGRRMIRVLFNGPGTLDAPYRVDAVTGKAEPWDEKRFGAYPEYSQVEVPIKDRKFVGTADTEDLWRNILRAEPMTSERANSVKLYQNPDGTFGVGSAAPDLGESAHNIQKGARFIGAYAPIYLREVMQTARGLGNAKVDLYARDALSPLVIRGENFEEHLMPMRGGSDLDQTEAKTFKGNPLYAEPLPPTTETKWKNTRIATMVETAKHNLADAKEQLKTATDRSRREILQERIKEAQATIRNFGKKSAKSGEKPIASESATLNPQSEPPPTGQVLGFGGGLKKVIPTIAATPKQVAHLVQTMTPGLQAAVSSKQGIQSLLLPTAKSPAHLRAAEMLGAKLGAMNQRQESAAHVLRHAGKLFDRLGVHNEKLPPDQNPGIQFMSDMSQGRPMTPKFQAVSDLIQKLFADRIDKLDAAGAPLQTVRDNYFPGMWTRESREAFNAAMVDGQAQGIIPKDIDVNSATPQQKAWIKQRVDEMLKAGTGSDQDMLAFFTRTPLKGKESFRKQKMFDDIMDAAQFGLRPISNNPIDLIKGKLAEMDKSIMANQFFQHLKEQKELKVINPYEETPQGWVRLNDKYGTIYGKPTVTVTEHIDKAVYEGLLNFASSLGIRHERSMKFPPGPGTRALGLSYQGQNFVRTRFATETSVLAHEIGHQIDHKYDLWNAITRGERGTERKSLVQKDLRTIADMTGSRGGNPRSKVEKIAQMVEAYVHSPDQMRTQAPTVFTLFDQFIRSKPDLKSLAEIRPGIELTKLTGEKYVGLPITGYRIVPEAVGDVVNNYLSSSLYNNKYFGNVYKAWMQTANALNQTQLGMGSAFHAGFTTGDVQISAGANLIKDLYGLVRGNRSLPELGQTAKNWTVSSLRTSFTGNKVLNAWRRPDGVLDPRIAQVVKATELAGGGYKMEHGLQTEQTTKMVRDWFSGHPIKAALRSPIAATELMAKPIMDLLVPRQKAGVFSELAWRIIEQNPGKDLEELTPQFRQAWNRVDARLGQVRYNRLFANNTAKNIVQALVRAPGWTGGTIAEIGGAFPDTYKFFKEWVDTGKPPQNIPDRVAYTMSLLMTVGVINAALTYAFTGQTPQGMDYLAFRTGRKDKDGNDERFLLPTYVKDLIAYAKQPMVTLGHKTHPLLSMVNDVYQNKDFYGYEIRNPHAGAGTQAGQVAKYVVKSFEPFWTRGERKMLEAGASPARAVAPLIGVMPAPGYVTRSKMQSEISELYHARTGERLKPYESRDADQEKRSAHDSSNMDVYMFKHLPKTDKEALRQKMTPEELDRYGR